MRLPVALGLGILLLGAPTGVAAQSYGTYSGTGGSYPYTSYTPTGYSPYSGFASYPGGYASGMLPSGYSTNPYASAYNASAAASGYNSIPYTYVSNTYNPYSPWAAAGSTTYPWATESGSGSNTASVYNAGAYPGYGTGQGSTASSTGYAAAYPYASSTPLFQPYGSTAYTGFASYPGGLGSGYTPSTANGYSSYVPQTAYTGAATSGYSSFVPQTAAPALGGYASGYSSGYGAISGYAVPSTMLTWGR